MNNTVKLRVYVDFNSLDQSENVIINADTPENQNIKPSLAPGLPVALYDETMEVEARVKWNEELKMWVGVPDWSTVRDF